MTARRSQEARGFVLRHRGYRNTLKRKSTPWTPCGVLGASGSARGVTQLSNKASQVPPTISSRVMLERFMRVSIGLHYFEIPRSMLCAIASGVLALQLVTAARLLAQETSVQTLLATRGDFTGLIDIGGGR